MKSLVYTGVMSSLVGVTLATILGLLPITPTDPEFWIIMVGVAVVSGVLVGRTAP